MGKLSEHSGKIGIYVIDAAYDILFTSPGKSPVTSKQHAKLFLDILSSVIRNLDEHDQHFNPNEGARRANCETKENLHFQPVQVRLKNPLVDSRNPASISAASTGTCKASVSTQPLSRSSAKRWRSNSSLSTPSMLILVGFLHTKGVLLRSTSLQAVAALGALS